MESRKDQTPLAPWESASSGPPSRVTASRVTVTPRERQRLLRYDRPLGPAIKDLITIVSPRTFSRWLQAEREPRRATRRPGRRPTPADVRTLIIRISRERG